MRSLARTTLTALVVALQVATANAHVLHHGLENVAESPGCHCGEASEHADDPDDHGHDNESPGPDHDCRNCFVCDSTDEPLTMPTSRTVLVASSPAVIANGAITADSQSTLSASVNTISGAPPDLVHAITLPLLN